MNFDPSTFAAGSKLPELQKNFVQTLAPAIARFCGNRLTREEMDLCLREAAMLSGWGRFVLGNNYWMLPGRGDAGAYLLVKVRQNHAEVSGVTPQVTKYAKFSSLPKALDAWCKRRGK